MGTLGPGTVFGELAMMYDCKRQATITATEAGLLWGLDRATYQKITASANCGDDQSRYVEILQKVPLLHGLSHELLEQTALAMLPATFNEGEYIVRQGENTPNFYVVRSGVVSVTQTAKGADKEVELMTLEAGQFFGENALKGDGLRAANCRAQGGKVRVLTITRQKFVDLLGDLVELLTSEFSQKVLMLAPWLQGLPMEERRKVAGRFERKEYSDGEVILAEGDAGDRLYVVLQGNVRIVTGGKDTAQLLPGSFFGEMSWLYPAPVCASAVAVGKCLCCFLPHADCETVLAPVRASISTECDMRRRLVAFRANVSGGFALDRLEVVRTLGEGGFSRVKLVTSPDHAGGVYALKCCVKAKIEKLRQETHIKCERDIVATLAFPFILRMHATFQDKRHIYMLFEAVMGGELFSVLERQGSLHPVAAKFYAGCLVAVFEHLHQRRIVYRDLKPENVMIDEHGYPKLIDFGFAKVLQQRTRSTCGTPDYFAPEILMGRGYLWSVDWWCVGVLVYEMLFGETPFEAETAMDMFKLIMTTDPTTAAETPNGHAVPADCKGAIDALLEKDPAKRLGKRSTAHDEVRQHAWFQGIDYEKLFARAIPAPWKPTLSSATDTSHFDEYDEEPLDKAADDAEASPSAVEWDF